MKKIKWLITDAKKYGILYSIEYQIWCFLDKHGNTRRPAKAMDALEERMNKKDGHLSLGVCSIIRTCL